ncbi:uncharacterized protein [Musca autumnalis]|uniref:uncharacterized protein n=1 Tax=Musca autumnalis TaxID=221902 RepID=UPI003CF1E901
MNIKLKCIFYGIALLTLAVNTEARGGGRGGRGGSRGGSHGHSSHSSGGSSSSSHSSGSHGSGSSGSGSSSHSSGSYGSSGGYGSHSSGSYGSDSHSYGGSDSHGSSSGYGSNYGGTKSGGFDSIGNSKTHSIDSTLSWKPYETSYSIPHFNSYGMNHHGYGNSDSSRKIDRDGLLNGYATGSMFTPDLPREYENLFSYRKLFHHTHSSDDSRRNSYPWDTTTTTTERNSYNYPLYGNPNLDEILSTINKINVGGSSMLELPKVSDEPITTSTSTTTEKNPLDFFNTFNTHNYQNDNVDDFLRNLPQILRRTVDETMKAIDQVEYKDSIETTSTVGENAADDISTTSTTELPVTTTTMPTTTTPTSTEVINVVVPTDVEDSTTNLPPVTESAFEAGKAEISTPYGVICYPLIQNKINEFGVNVTIETIACYPAPEPIKLESIQE